MTIDDLRADLKQKKDLLAAYKLVPKLWTPDGRTYSDLKTEIAWLEDAIDKEIKRAELLRKRSNLGKRFANRTFDSFDADRDKQAFQAAKKYDPFTKEDRNSLLIIGDCGTGKTHLAAAIGNRAMDNGIAVLFDSYVGYLEKLKAEFGTDERTFLMNMKSVPLLIIDDIGKENQTEWSIATMFDVINYRYEHLLPIVFTSNLTKEELQVYLGRASYSRLCEICTGIKTNSADKRKEKRA